ncbi:BTAD domain-containing putative transcriptional regulator [Paenibacillus algorifonticola]|uniref:BTAD domain-containing putative transcriptional regulator n=1 Tax=Paenibacillus algorifonticola TaxID=684063 RepID=UPI003D267D85
MIVQTKLFIPHVHNPLVLRPRLIRMLDGGLEAKLTLITASAGYGKTTALSEWARQIGVPVAWVSLDKQDDAWIPFWSCVTASIQEKVPGFAQTVGPLLEKGPSASSVSLEPVISAMLNALDQHSGELAIVLDDYHLIEHPDIQKSLTYMLEHMPSHIHLYIASRTELSIPTARLLAKGEMLRITVQDLRFHMEEGLIFFRDTTDLSLSGEQVAELFNQTEGWISGLQLAALTLKSSVNIAESIRQFSGHQHYISNYLFEEVFRDLPEDMCTFLLQTSILSRMNNSLCQAVTGHSSSQAYLEKLEQLNLFTIPLDDHRHWFRYHPLLSDFLQRQFSRTAPELWAQAHVRAAQWQESHGFEEEAVEHYLEGRQYDDVVRIIEKNLQDFLHKKAEKVSGWVLQLPESVLSKRPMVEMFYLSFLIGIRQWEPAARKIEQAKIRYEAMRGSMDDAEWKQIMGNMYFLCASASYFQKDLEGISKYFALSECVAPEGSLFESMGDNKYYGYDEFDDHMSYINDYHAAAAFMIKWIQHWGQCKTHPSAAIFQASYSTVLYEWNRLEEAEALIDQLLKPSGKKYNTRSLLQIYVSASRIQQASGNQERALELLEELKLRIESPEYGRFLRKIEAEQACLAVRQRSMPYALEWLERCGIAAADELSLNGVAEYMALARVLAACGRTDEAIFLSEALQRLFWKEDRLRDRIKMVILQSVTLYHTDQTQKALSMLDTALRLAEPEGFIRSFADEGHVMVEMLSAYFGAHQEHRPERVSSVLPGYANRLLQTLNNPHEQSKTPMSIEVRCFGRFHVRTGQADKDEIKWRTSKTKELMAYLIHHRGEPIDKYRIIDALWSDFDAKRAVAQLNTTVHYLRKQLESAGLNGSIHYVKGYYKLEMNRLDCDYDAFRRLVSGGIPIATEEVKAYEKELANVYLTGYLEDSAFTWAEQARSRLESEYVGLLLQIHEHYVQEKEFSAASAILKRALACDPFNESLHTKLIRVYVLADDRISAKKQYDWLHHMLQTEFGVEVGKEAKQWMDIH